MFTRDGTDPVLRALRAAEAAEVPLDDFRMCNSRLGVELPVSGSSYRARKLRPRRVCVARTHGWQVALRVGNPPSGALTNSLKYNTQTPPGVGKTNFREVIAISQAPNQIGAPATQTADTNLGSAFYAYRSAAIALPPGGNHRDILLRVEGAASHRGSGERLQKAKVGNCVRCSEKTHIAVPPNNPTGSYVETKCMGATLWQTKGPRAGRALAARQYWNWYGASPTHWRWGARFGNSGPLSVIVYACA